MPREWTQYEGQSTKYGEAGYTPKPAAEEIALARKEREGKKKARQTKSEKDGE